MDESDDKAMDVDDNIDDVDSDDSSLSDDVEDQKVQEQIKELQKQIHEFPNYYDGHVTLIKALRDSGELIGARHARENMNKIYPLSPELWLEWVKDEQTVCTTDEEKAFIVSLLDRACKEYTSVEVWTEYLLFSVSLECSQSVADRALGAVGCNVRDGDLVWQAVMMVEEQKYGALLATEADEKTKEEKKKRVQTLLRRRLNVPVLNMDGDALLMKVEEYFGEVDDHMKKCLEKTKQKLKSLEPFEDQLLKTEEDKEQNVEAYLAYIHHLQKDNNPNHMLNIYERAVCSHPLGTGLWLSYCQYCLKQFPSNVSLVTAVCERSVRNCPWSGTLLSLLLRVITKDANSEQQLRNSHKKIKTYVDRCLGALAGVEEAALIENAGVIWRSYLVYLSHCIKWDRSEGETNGGSEGETNGGSEGAPSSPDLSDFRQAAKEAMEMLRTNSSSRFVLFDADASIASLWAGLEARANNVEAARTVYNDLMKNYSGRSDLWLQFISLERRHGSTKHARKLFRRALERVFDNTEVVGAEYQLFEEVYGDTETLEEFHQRYNNRMTIVYKKREEEKAKEASKEDQNKGKKNKPKDEWQNKRDGRGTKRPADTQHKSDDKTSPTKKRKLGEHSSVGTPSVGSSPVKQQTNKTESKPPHVTRIESKISPSEQPRTVFVSNLSFDTSVETVKAALSDCGEIESAKLVPDYKGRSKGFGYVTFTSTATVDVALKKDRMMVDKRPMFISGYNTSKSGHKFQYATNLEKDKLFVKGLPFSMSEAQVKESFEAHGPVTEIRLVTHRNGYSKGICFVKFPNSKIAETARKAMDQTELKGCVISVMVSDPSQAGKDKEEVKPPIGARKSTISFVPRSLAAKNKPKPQEEGTVKPKSNDDFRKLLG